MTGELSIGGVYVPALLVLAVLALLLTAVVARLMASLGAYRLVAYRPLVDLAIFMLLLGLLSLVSGSFGPSS
jgi:hypothetical protein